jgi:hypothetical protein
MMMTTVVVAAAAETAAPPPPTMTTTKSKPTNCSNGEHSTNTVFIWAQHWTWYNAKCSHIQLDTGPVRVNWWLLVFMPVLKAKHFTFIFEKHTITGKEKR